MRIIFLLMAALGTAAIGNPAGDARTVILEADEWCPINCAPGGGQLGLAVDIAKSVFEAAGYKLEYRIVPWTQALRDVHSGKADGVIGANRRDDASLLFPSEALMTMTDDFYVLRGSSWRYQGVHTLKGKRVGVVSGYGYGNIVTHFLAESSATRGKVLEVSGARAQAESINRLREGKVDLIVEAKPVMDYYLRSRDLTAEVIWAGGVPQEPIYVGFSPESIRGSQLRALYDAGVRRLRQSGELSRLYRAYGLQP